MQQTSLIAWLRKPKAVTDAPAATLAKPPTAAGPVARDAISAFTPALQQQQHATHSAAAAAPAPPPSPTPPPPPNFSNLRPLAPNVELTPLTPALAPAFKRLNSLLLPVAYPPSFYDESIADATISSITLLALWHDEPHTTSTATAPAPAPEAAAEPEPKTTPPALVAAAIRCRLAPSPSPNPTLYISTLCVLPSHRHHGLAAHLLACVTAVAITQYGVGGVTAHVWEANADAREWYAKRGFREEAREEAYYRKLRPAGAVVVRRGVGVRDLVGWGEVVGGAGAG